jgi:hypothetical protein
MKILCSVRAGARDDYVDRGCGVTARDRFSASSRSCCQILLDTMKWSSDDYRDFESRHRQCSLQRHSHRSIAESTTPFFPIDMASSQLPV